MNISFQWLKDYCDFSGRFSSPGELAEKLTFAGLEVEEIIPRDDDFILVTEVTTNRPDWLSIIAVARELRAVTGLSLLLPEVRLPEGPESIEDYFSLVVEDPVLCPRYTGRLLFDLEVAPSPGWLRKRLEAVGLRPVNSVVDVTNYVLWECGQPLHAFDFDKLEGGKIVVRRARPGEEIVTIDGRRRQLAPEMLVIADARKALAIAGVMGGIETEVGFGTKRVLLESARFHPANVRETSRELGLSSDSSYRFERGVDPEGVEWASRRASGLIFELAGGKVARGLADANFERREVRRVRLRHERLEALLGMKVPREVAREILLLLEFSIVEESSDSILVEVPSFRLDVAHEADLIEEVARIYGYDKVPAICGLSITLGRKSPSERLVERARELLVSMGLLEVMTYSFMVREGNGLFSPWSASEPLIARGGSYREGKRLRMALLPSLVEVKRINEHRGNGPIRIFEHSAVYLPVKDQKLPREQKNLAVLLDGDFLEAKGILSKLVENLGCASPVEYLRHEDPFFAHGRSSKVTSRGTVLGFIGEIAPRVLESFDLASTPTGFEVNLDAALGLVNLEARYEALPKFPASERDLAIVVDEDVPWVAIETAIREAVVHHLEEVRFFDEYRGEQVEPGKKSIAFRLVFRHPERTLRHEEVEDAKAQVVKALSVRLNASLRGE